MQPTEQQRNEAIAGLRFIIEQVQRAITALESGEQAPTPLPPPPCKPVGEGEAAGQPSPLPPHTPSPLLTLSTLSGLVHLHRGDLIRFKSGNGSRVMVLREAPVIEGERRLCGFGDDGVDYTASLYAVLGVCRDRETWERIQPTEGQPATPPTPQPAQRTDLLAASRALIKLVKFETLGFRDGHGNAFSEAAQFTDFMAWTAVAADDKRPRGDHHSSIHRLVALVEGPGSPRWAAGGLRLKDTREWCAFYCAVKAAEREGAA